ncbi:MAG TPA: MFS transporter [Euzebyales bacterium]|nr:MFS transporter [Euzebyales bacterium]
MPALRPLGDREFRLLTFATLTSVLGDGMMRVALPLQVLAITNDDPLAIGFVGLAWTLGHAVSLPLGGVTSDRHDRRSVMIGSDLVRALAIGTMALLALSGALRLPQVIALGLSFGFANGFFNPASRSLVPDLIPTDELPTANALLGFARPLQLWVIGPLVGGAVVGLAGPGAALLVDAGTFLVSAALLARLSRRGPAAEPAAAGIVADAREGLAYVSANRWAAVWFTASALSTLAFHGPFDVLVPTMLKTDVGLSEAQAGWWMAMIFASGGVGALLASSFVGQRGLPRRFMLLLYSAEALSLFGLAMFAFLTRFWEALVIGLVVFGAVVTSEIIGDTNLQREVPRHLLGRVTSLEWFVAIGMAPISFAIAGPLGRILGPRPVLVAFGVFAGTAVAALAIVPGARSPELRRRRPGGRARDLAQAPLGGTGGAS